MSNVCVYGYGIWTAIAITKILSVFARACTTRQRRGFGINPF